MKNHQLGMMTVEEVTNYLKNNKTIILPYALAEQHGYHMPLDTDLRNCNELAARLAERLDCVIAPTLNYCFSGGQLPGTINIKPNTFSNLVGEIIESLHLQGFRNFVIIPGHGGSESLVHLKESMRILKWLNPTLRDALIVFAPPWDFAPSWMNLFKTRDYHAAQAETSMLLYWCPEVVRKKVVMDSEEVAERLRDDPDSYQLRESFTDLPNEIPQTSQRDDVKIGVMGYPERATVELGKAITDEFVENAGNAIEAAVKEADERRASGEMRVLENKDKMKILTV